MSNRAERDRRFASRRRAKTASEAPKGKKEIVAVPRTRLLFCGRVDESRGFFRPWVNALKKLPPGCRFILTPSQQVGGARPKGPGGATHIPTERGTVPYIQGVMRGAGGRRLLLPCLAVRFSKVRSFAVREAGRRLCQGMLQEPSSSINKQHQ